MINIMSLERNTHEVKHFIYKDSVPKGSLRQTIPGKTYVRTIKDNMAEDRTRELDDIGLSLGEARATAKARTLWRSIITVALCFTGDEGYK